MRRVSFFQRVFVVSCATWLMAMLAMVQPAAAQNCGTDYTIKEGETLAQIAARVYGNPSQWTIIYYSNQDRIGTNATLMVPGLAIRLPCVGGLQAQPSSAPAPLPAANAAPSAAVAESGVLLSSMVRRIEFLTADGYAPYTGRSLENGGLFTHVVSAAMEQIKAESKGRFEFGVSWVNDWAAHLNPLLMTRAFDMGFPWTRPNCEAASDLEQGAQFRCQRFFFSEPVYEAVTAVFVRQDSRIRSLRTEEISGASICRPAGYSVNELDEGGKNWLKEGRVTLIRPPSVDDCFRLVADGSADAVAIAELTGQSSIVSLGLGDRVRPLDPPLALTSLHVVVPKTHPHARTMLYYVNTALAKLRESGDQDRIIERHLARFWDAQNAAPNAAVGTVPAAKPRTNAPAPAIPAAAPASSPTGTASASAPAKSEPPSKKSQ